MTYRELMELLEKNHCMTGENAVWVLKTAEYWNICSYFTKTGKIFPNVMKFELRELSETGEFFLNAYLSPDAWHKAIYAHFNGSMSSMYHDGWADEVLYCMKLMKES